MYKIILFFLFVSILFGCNSTRIDTSENLKKNYPSKISLKQIDGKYKLFVNQQPFFIKGAGLEFGKIASVAKHHGNSFRTWRTENGKQSGKEVLDEAYKYGLMVTMGIEVGRERHGFDYNNEAAVKEQFERIKKEVIALKDHPSLMIWAIGNELNLRYTNPKVWDAVNEISKMIHEVDPNHLTTTCIAGISKKEVDYIKDRCQDLDLLSIQMYGKLPELPGKIKEYGWDKAYMVTEWGATGHWEVPKTEWGVPIEENSTVKAAKYLNRYKSSIETDLAQCVGGYVFLWGQKQERTPTWYGIFLENGDETESVDVMHYLWNNAWPQNRTPQIQSYTLNHKTAYENVVLSPNEEYLANVKVSDFENDKVNYRWEILKESTDLKDGGDFELRPDEVQINVINKTEGDLIFKTPNEKGFYRLFVYVDDTQGHAATANIPFMIK